MMISEPNIKHSNDKIIINLYLYNKNKMYLSNKLKTLWNSFTSTKHSKHGNWKSINKAMGDTIVAKDIYLKRKLFTLNKYNLTNSICSTRTNWLQILKKTDKHKIFILRNLKYSGKTYSFFY